MKTADTRLELVLGGAPADISTPLSVGQREVGTVVHECNRRLSQLLAKEEAASGVQASSGGERATAGANHTQVHVI